MEAELIETCMCHSLSATNQCSSNTFFQCLPCNGAFANQAEAQVLQQICLPHATEKNND